MNAPESSSILKDLVVLGPLIKQLRETRGLKQGDLARGLCTPSMISQVETGKARPSLDLLTEIAKRLDADVHFFFESKELSSDSLTYHIAKVYMGTRRYDEAAALLQGLMNANGTHPDSSPMLVDLIQCYVQLGKLREVERLLDAMREHEDPEIHARLLHIRGLLLSQAKRDDKAIPLWEKAVALLLEMHQYDHYFHVALLLHLSEAHARLGHPERALEICEQAIPNADSARTLPDQAKTCLQLAKEFHEQGVYTKAIHYANRARHLNDVHLHRVEAKRNRIESDRLKSGATVPAPSNDPIATLARQHTAHGDYLGACNLLLQARDLMQEDLNKRGMHLASLHPPAFL